MGSKQSKPTPVEIKEKLLEAPGKNGLLVGDELFVARDDTKIMKCVVKGFGCGMVVLFDWEEGLTMITEEIDKTKFRFLDGFDSLQEQLGEKFFRITETFRYHCATAAATKAGLNEAEGDPTKTIRATLDENVGEKVWRGTTLSGRTFYLIAKEQGMYREVVVDTSAPQDEKKLTGDWFDRVTVESDPQKVWLRVAVNGIDVEKGEFVELEEVKNQCEVAHIALLRKNMEGVVTVAMERLQTGQDEVFEVRGKGSKFIFYYVLSGKDTFYQVSTNKKGGSRTAVELTLEEVWGGLKANQFEVEDVEKGEFKAVVDVKDENVRGSLEEKISRVCLIKGESE